MPCQHGKQRMGRLKGEDSGLLACLLLFISSGLPISLIVGEIFSVSLLSEFIPPLLDCFYARDRVLLRPRHCPWRSSLCPRGARNRAIKRRPGRVLGVIIPHLSFPFLSFPFLSFPFLSFPFRPTLTPFSSNDLPRSPRPYGHCGHYEPRRRVEASGYDVDRRDSQHRLLSRSLCESFDASGLPRSSAYRRSLHGPKRHWCERLEYRRIYLCAQVSPCRANGETETWC